MSAPTSADLVDHGRRGAAPLSARTRSRLRARHTVRLVRELARHGREQRLWWLLPVAVVMLMFALAIVTTSTVVPVAVYTLF